MSPPVSCPSVHRQVSFWFDFLLFLLSNSVSVDGYEGFAVYLSNPHTNTTLQTCLLVETAMKNQFCLCGKF